MFIENQALAKPQGPIFIALHQPVQPHMVPAIEGLHAPSSVPVALGSKGRSGGGELGLYPAVLIDPEAVLPLDLRGGIGGQLFVFELKANVAIAVADPCGKGAFKAVAF